MQNHYRHGDVSFHQVTEEEAMAIIGKNKPKVRSAKSFVVALGEVTGHKHVMTAERPTIDIYGVFAEQEKVDMSAAEVLFHVKEPVSMTHEEHAKIALEPGFYVRKIEREFDPFTEQFRQSAD